MGMFPAETNLIIGHGMRSERRERGCFAATLSPLLLDPGVGRRAVLLFLGHVSRSPAASPAGWCWGTGKAAGATNELLFSPAT